MAPYSISFHSLSMISTDVESRPRVSNIRSTATSFTFQLDTTDPANLNGILQNIVINYTLVSVIFDPSTLSELNPTEIR